MSAPMSALHTVRVAVRGYEIDANGHVNHAVYHQYGEHARTEHLVAAGCTVPVLLAAGLGPVLLETTVRFLRELSHGDEVDVESRLAFGSGKTFAFEQALRRADGVVVAEITALMGLLDQATRRLVADPRGRLAAVATTPELLGALPSRP